MQKSLKPAYKAKNRLLKFGVYFGSSTGLFGKFWALWRECWKGRGCSRASIQVQMLWQCVRNRTQTGVHGSPEAVEAFAGRTRPSESENTCVSYIQKLSPIQMCVSTEVTFRGYMLSSCASKHVAQKIFTKSLHQVFSVTISGWAMCWLLGLLPGRAHESCVWFEEEFEEIAKPRSGGGGLSVEGIGKSQIFYYLF